MSAEKEEPAKPKKIKLVVSDLHLGKGRLLRDGKINSLEEFFYGEKFVEFLHFYTSGKYADFEVELIINGDFLNFLQVDFKGHYLSVITESVSLEKLKVIVEGHSEVFGALRDFAARPNCSITYVVGNHDQGMLWPATRLYLNQIVESSINYKNIVYLVDGVHIEHGHMYEAANRMDPRKFFLKKNLPEPILNLPFGSHFFVEFVLKIKIWYPHIDKVRPFSRMLKWSFFNESKFFVKGIFKLFRYLIETIFFRDPRKSWPISRILKVFVESAVFPDLSDAAGKILRNKRVHTVIFGHTHVYQYRQYPEGKEYFNTGTWTELTSLDIEMLGKITKLTYVLLEYPEEDCPPRGRLKEWRGYHRIEEDIAVS